jgi:hypothetical protein
MGKTIRIFVASLAALAMLATIGLAPAFAAEMVPHKARAAGSFTANADMSQLHLVGSGNATHLGAVTSDGHIAFLGGPDGAGCFTIHDDQVLTSTDTGEQIWISVDGAACPVNGPTQPVGHGVYRIVAPFAITGGTGRFAGASGGGNAVCFGDFDHGTFSYTQQGTISRPNSH